MKNLTIVWNKSKNNRWLWILFKIVGLVHLQRLQINNQMDYLLINARIVLSQDRPVRHSKQLFRPSTLSMTFIARKSARDFSRKSIRWVYVTLSFGYVSRKIFVATADEKCVHVNILSSSLTTKSSHYSQNESTRKNCIWAIKWA